MLVVCLPDSISVSRRSAPLRRTMGWRQALAQLDESSQTDHLTSMARKAEASPPCMAGLVAHRALCAYKADATNR